MACVPQSLKYLFSSLMWTKFAHPWLRESWGRDILGSGQRRPLCGRDPIMGRKRKKKKNRQRNPVRINST